MPRCLSYTIDQNHEPRHFRREPRSSPKTRSNQQFQLGLCIIGHRPTGQLGNGASNVPLGNVATVVMQTRSDMRQALIQRMVKFTVRLDSMLRALPPSGRGRRPRRGDASPAVVPFGDSPGCRCDCLSVITYDIMMTFWKSKIESWRGCSRQRTRLRRA